MSDTVITNLLTQAPMAAAVIMVVMLLLKNFQQVNQDQQKELQTFIDQQNQRWQQQMTAERTSYHDTFSLERERRKEAMNQGLREVQLLASSIDKLAAMVVAQSDGLSRHDAAAKERHDALLRSIAESRKHDDGQKTRS